MTHKERSPREGETEAEKKEGEGKPKIQFPLKRFWGKAEEKKNAKPVLHGLVLGKRMFRRARPKAPTEAEAEASRLKAMRGQGGDAALKAQEVEELADKVSSILADNGGTVDRFEYWGLRTLAYRIENNRQCH